MRPTASNLSATLLLNGLLLEILTDSPISCRLLKLSFENQDVLLLNGFITARII